MSDRKPIPVPSTSLARLEQLITQRNTIDGQIEVIVATLRDALEVPADYLIADVRSGFTPPPREQEQEAST